MKKNPSLPSNLSMVLPTSIPWLSSAELETGLEACNRKVLTANTAGCRKYNRYMCNCKKGCNRAEKGSTRAAKYFSRKLKCKSVRHL